MTTRHKTCGSVLSVLLLLVLAAFPARGDVVLLDAETDQDVKAWSGLERVTGDRVPYLPLRGAGSARLQVAAPRSATGGRRVEVRHASLPVTDWRSYDRLVLDVLNDGPVPTLMRIEVNTASNEAQRHFALPAGRWVRIVLPTAQLDPELADLSRVRDIQIAVYRQSQPLMCIWTTCCCCRPAKPCRRRRRHSLPKLVRRLKAEVDRTEQAFAETRAAFTTRQAASIADWTGSSALEELKDIRRLLDAPDASLDVLASLGDRIDRAGRRWRACLRSSPSTRRANGPERGATKMC